MITAKDILKTTISQLANFETFQQYINNSDNPHVMSEQFQRDMCVTLHLDYDNMMALNHLQLALCLGLPSPYHEINVVVQGFLVNDLSEVRTLFSQHMPEETVVDLYEHGLNLRQAHEKSWAARRFVDMAVYLHASESEQLEDSSTVCIGFPGMPNMAPLIASAIDAAQRHLFDDGHWYSELVPVGFTQHMYRCIPKTSAEGSVILETGCGTVYLSGRPKRGDTNSNHLRTV